MADTPRIDNIPYRTHRHGPWTIEGWSRAGIQSYWRIPELRVGFDLGAIPWDWTPTNVWFVSHAHLDHLLALPGFLARRAALKYPPPTVYVPAEIVDDVRGLLSAWRALDRGPQECTLIGLGPGDAVELADDRFATAFATTHTVPSRGYVIWERRHKLRPEYVGLSGGQIRDLKDQRVEVTEAVRVPLVCYTGDTSAEALDANPVVYEAKVLITELSFARAEHSPLRIREFGHMHLNDFVQRADRFQNELIVAGHVTSRDEPESFRRMAQQSLPPSLFQRLIVWD